MLGGVKNPGQPKAQQAQWNVQVVRGKVTTRCLWNACKALSIGLLLLTIGTTMAVIGYYADQLSIRSETRGNSTVKIKNETRGFHLNNLSYAGPIVMGIGGFIVVAACVMTFEARDSAAKVVPARFKSNLNASITGESTKTTPRTSRSFRRMDSKKSTSVQTPGRERCSGIFKMDSSGTGNDWSPKNDSVGRRAFTAAFVQFSRELLENSNLEANPERRRKIIEANLNKSPSAPDLAGENLGSPNASKTSKSNPNKKYYKGSPNISNRSQEESGSPLETISSGYFFLRPNHLQRQALSVDNPFYDSCECYTPSFMKQQSRRSGGSQDSFELELGSSAGVSGSQTSMALDLHDCQVTLKVKDESANKRSDTAKRHQLLRQKPVEDDIILRCSCIPRFSCSPRAEDCSVRNKSNINVKSPCHTCLRATGNCTGQAQNPKMTGDIRSQSFSHAFAHGDCKKPTCREDSCKIFCVDDHRRRHISSENLKICGEEKFRFGRKHSAIVSPHRSPRKQCRVQRMEGIECLLHGTKTSPGGCAPVRNNAKKRKKPHKIEGSLSAEEPRSGIQKNECARSASFSPTRKTETSTPSSSGKQSCVSVVELVGGGAKDEEKTNEKTERDEPS